MKSYQNPLRAGCYFSAQISSIIAFATQLKNDGELSVTDIQRGVKARTSTLLSTTQTSLVFDAALNLTPTLSVSVAGVDSILDVMIEGLSRIMTNDVLAFCGIECSPLAEVPTSVSQHQPVTAKQRPSTTPALAVGISDALRDELSGANVQAGGVGDNDCGDSCKI